MKITASEIRQELSGISPAQIGTLKIIVEEQYTPSDFLAQRYRVSLVAVRKNKRHYIATEGDLINPADKICNWMLSCGLTTDDLIFKIP